MLRIITLVFEGGELLGSGPSRFIPGEEVQYKLPRWLCGSQSQSGILPEFETWDHPAHNLVGRPTAPVLFKNLIWCNLVAY